MFFLPVPVNFSLLMLCNALLIILAVLCYRGGTSPVHNGGSTQHHSLQPGPLSEGLLTEIRSCPRHLCHHCGVSVECITLAS